MKSRVELSLWICAGVFAASSALVWRHAVPVELPHYARPSAPTVATSDSARVRRSAQLVITSDPFRIGREPSPLRFEPHRGPVALAAAPLPSSPKPMLLVRGIVGPPWAAVLEGLPGRNGPAVVRAGDKFGELAIRVVMKDTVLVQGLDTTWRLGVAHRWQ